MDHASTQRCCSEMVPVAKRMLSLSMFHSFVLNKIFHSVVLAITKKDVDVLPTLFKTYAQSRSLRDCTIWQVARATSAATTFFKSIKCGRDGIEFIDAGFGYNIPCGVLLDEVKKIFP